MSSPKINCLIFIDPDILDNFLKNHANDHKKLLLQTKHTSKTNNYFYFTLEQQYLSLTVHVQDKPEETYPGKQLDANYYFDSTIDIYFYGFDNPKVRYDYYFSSTPRDISCSHPRGNNDVTILRGVKKGSLFSDSFYQENQEAFREDYLTFTKNEKKINYIPPYAFSKRKAHKFIILESIIQTILIKQIQENPSSRRIKVAIVSHPYQLRCFVEKYVDVNNDINKRLGSNFFDYFRRLFGIKLVIKEKHTKVTLFSKKYSSTGYPTQDVSTMEYKIPTKDNEGWEWSILGCDLEIFIFNQGESYDKKRTYNLVFDTKLIDGQIAELRKLKQKRYQEINGGETLFQNEESVLIRKEYSNSSQESSSVLQIFNFDGIDNDFDYYFTSSLLRSRETFKAFFPHHKKVIILPCAQEISYYVDKCYDKNQKTIFKAPENIVNDLRSNLPTNLQMDWSFYNNSSCPKGSNLIEEMIKIIFYKKIEEKKYELQNDINILSNVFGTDLEESQITIDFLNYFDKNPNKFEHIDATEYVAIYLDQYRTASQSSILNFETDPYFETEVELYKYLSYLQKLVWIYYTNNDIGNFYTFIEAAKRFDIFKNSLSSISLDNLQVMFEKIKNLTEGGIFFYLLYFEKTILTEKVRYFLQIEGRKKLEEIQKKFNVEENLREKINIDILCKAIDYLNNRVADDDTVDTIFNGLDIYLNKLSPYKRDIKIIEKFIGFMADFLNSNGITMGDDGRLPDFGTIFSNTFDAEINSFLIAFEDKTLFDINESNLNFDVYQTNKNFIIDNDDRFFKKIVLYHHVIVSTKMTGNTLNVTLGRKIRNYMPERLKNDTSVQPFSSEFLFMNPMECCTELLREREKHLEKGPDVPPPKIDPKIEEQFKKFLMTKHDENKLEFDAWSGEHNDETSTTSSSVSYTNSRVCLEYLDTNINFDLLNRIFTEFKEKKITQLNCNKKILDYAEKDKNRETCFFLIKTAHYMNDNTIQTSEKIVLNEYNWFYVYFIQNFINNYRAYHLQNTADEYFQIITEFLNGFLNGSSDYLQIFNMSELLRRSNADTNVINTLFQRYIIKFPEITQENNSENYFTKLLQQKRQQQQQQQQQRRRRKGNENSTNPNDPNS